MVFENYLNKIVCMQSQPVVMVHTLRHPPHRSVKRASVHTLITLLLCFFQIVKEQKPHYSLRVTHNPVTRPQCGIGTTLCVTLDARTWPPSLPTGNRAAFAQRDAQWWRMTGSNRRPPACKAGALPAELIPQNTVVGQVGIEPTTPALSRRCSNRLSY